MSLEERDISLFRPAAVIHSPLNLCNHCQYIFDNWSEVTEDEYQVHFSHCENIFALQLSATQGCPLCGQFLQNLASRGELDLARDATIELFNNGSLPSRWRVRVMSLNRILSSGSSATLAGYKLLELRFRLDNLEVEDAESDLSESQSSLDDDVADEDSEFEDAGVRQPDEFVCKVILMPASTEPLLRGNSQTISANSKDALNLAKAWLKNCFDHHNRCTSLQKFLPTRLLFLDGDTITLRLPSTLHPETPYATLSHFWGSLCSLKLTGRNFQLLQEGFHVGTLCKTFQDAVYICRKLGLRFLWIDSLCIMQDDPDDWREESKMMSSVYSGSTINIAATSAADGNGGCFFNRDANHSWRHRIKAKVDGQEMQYECVEDGISDACLFLTPLANRAWALQERLLAPRTLHCSRSQLFWECNSTTACEAFPQKFPDTLKYDDFQLPKPCISRFYWPTIVKLYSRCLLTFGKDKLVAISGIAKRIYDRDPGDNNYIAGLWRRRIEEQLCWKVRTQMPKVETPRAPSWSWAAVDGIIDFPVTFGYNYEQYIDVLDVSIGSHDPFGEIPTGKLTINCGLLLQGALDNVGAVFEDQSKLGYTGRRCRFRFDLDYLEERPEIVHFLPVMKDVTRSLDVGGLLLEQSEGHPTEYRRIGYFECDADWFKDFEIRAQGEDCDKTQETSKIKSHIITII